MTISCDIGEAPRVCANCPNSYWEDMVSGEEPYCAEYKTVCNKAICECTHIGRCTR